MPLWIEPRDAGLPLPGSRDRSIRRELLRERTTVRVIRDLDLREFVKMRLLAALSVLISVT